MGILEYMATILTLRQGNKEIEVKNPEDHLEYTEFMELVEMLIINSKYSQHEYESYVLNWAADIKAKREN